MDGHQAVQVLGHLYSLLPMEIHIGLVQVPNADFQDIASRGVCHGRIYKTSYNSDEVNEQHMVRRLPDTDLVNLDLL